MFFVAKQEVDGVWEDDPPKIVEATTYCWPSLHAAGPRTADLCCYCFQVLLAHLHSKPAPEFPGKPDPSLRAPLFVTWLKQREDSKLPTKRDLELRGCIGCLEPVVLMSGLSEYVIRSSMQDKRFSPVALSEVACLVCKLSILHEFEVCRDPYDWEVGVHGVLINFSDPSSSSSGGRQYSATYLPEVPKEHGMSREKTISELVAKSGYTGPCNEALLGKLQVTRYRTTVDSVGYWDYLKLSGSSSTTFTYKGSTTPPVPPPLPAE
mmetsp:Transcript_26431/g.55965  ORF Transcript_26431/g.55965 Transcript_26431/m.55965 type:complete len:265 (-) Transcript_26431:191-985(-)